MSSRPSTAPRKPGSAARKPVAATRRPSLVRKKPGRLARSVCIGTFVLSPLALFVVAGSFVFNGRPVSGATLVTLKTVGPSTGSTGFVHDGAVVTGRSSIEVEVQDGLIDAAYYLGIDMLHGLAALVVLLAAVVAVGVLRRRPVSWGVVGILGTVAVYCLTAAFLVPRKREWAMRETIEKYGLPTTLGEARAVGASFQVTEPSVQAFAWTWGFLGGAIVATGALLWVLFLRRQLVRR